MAKKKSRKEIAQEKVLEEGLDYVLEVYEAKDFVEVVGRMGGDTITYRVFDDGRIYER